MNERAFLLDLFKAGVAAVHPSGCVAPHLPALPKGRVIVVGAGKAAASMAQAVEKEWAHIGDRLSGLVVTRYGHGVACTRIEVVEAAHPIPDEAGRIAAKRILKLVSNLKPDDLVLCLISGGGSALLTLPPEAVPLADKQNLTRQLLTSGAAISEINTVRKHLSAIKGGRLAEAAFPAGICSLIISDVPGDDASMVASGPALPDRTTREEALAVIAKYGISPAASAARWLADPASETPKPGGSKLARATFRIIASAKDMLGAAAREAERRGVRPIILGDDFEGEARDLAKHHAARVRAARANSEAPCVLLSGGETSVTVTGGGRGGRNSEFLLALALELHGLENVFAIACDSDGIDGTEDNAGVVVTPDTLDRARARNVSASAYLARNDAYGFFHTLGDLVRTGPTCTNANDFRAILIR